MLSESEKIAVQSAFPDAELYEFDGKVFLKSTFTNEAGARLYMHVTGAGEHEIKAMREDWLDKAKAS